MAISTHTLPSSVSTTIADKMNCFSLTYKTAQPKRIKQQTNNNKIV